MSEQPLTCEGVLESVREMFREMALKSDQERMKREAEYERRDKALNKKISDLGFRIGQIVDMIDGNIIDKFRALGYNITQILHNRLV